MRLSTLITQEHIQVELVIVETQNRAWLTSHRHTGVPKTNSVSSTGWRGMVEGGWGAGGGEDKRWEKVCVEK